MKLADALGIQRGDIVSLVGAGGKTSALFRLARELADQGWRVVSTTTTRLSQDELRFAPQRLGLGHLTRIPASLQAELDQFRHVFIFTKIATDNKVQGVRAAWLDENLVGLPNVDALLVEADGSRRLPIKAPLPHEPPIPASSTIVIPVIGLSALDQPLDDDHVYGADIIHNLTGHPLGAPISGRLMAALLMNPQVGLKNIPPTARIAALLNQVSDHTLERARQIAADALTDLNIERVMIGAVQDDDPVREVQRRVGAIVLAAGQSKRMKQPKMLLPWGDSTLIRHVCQQVAAARLYEVVVVAGEHAEEIQKQVADLPVQVVLNPDFAKGEMLSSLKVGLKAVEDRWAACLVVLGDQPSIEPSIITSLLDAYARGLGGIVAPSYQNRRGHPLLIDRAYWQAILDLPTGKAPRDVLRANEDAIYHVEMETDAVLTDIDTPEDYERARMKG